MSQCTQPVVLSIHVAIAACARSVCREVSSRARKVVVRDKERMEDDERASTSPISRQFSFIRGTGSHPSAGGLPVGLRRPVSENALSGGARPRRLLCLQTCPAGLCPPPPRCTTRGGGVALPRGPWGGGVHRPLSALLDLCLGFRGFGRHFCGSLCSSSCWRAGHPARTRLHPGAGVRHVLPCSRVFWSAVSLGLASRDSSSPPRVRS